MSKTLGIIGGLSPESTIAYYEYITRAHFERTGRYPDIVVRSVDLAQYTAWFSAGDWERAGADMARIFEQMRSIGVDLGLISANTPHRAMPYVLSATSLPILSITAVTADSITERGFSTVGLLGTRFTMREEFFKEALGVRGINAIVPDDDDIETVNRVIYEELVRGIVKDESRGLYREIIGRLVAKGAAGVILGCTEIPLLIKAGDVDIPLFDTTQIHAEAAVREIMAE
jgi:aspartate racemase